ncbi:uncharacterized protein BO87DRAFT_221088 [Aspergillus neoniger CBS 115656]|uniref:Uncharacterized protein n=1 Tax=Aspergillus neoniger (strain CBS 115656) TaxID=1448310 RepID=A0A318YRZ2_ASPNB|nr:hypothetical protein BO87DRAFT_221088 [Aspergillus neoniger CBS 115656]PYH37094.1 hypothetical protein BO87DRAFT_221088 [Aspergillus neoniger CBS 115656]
MNGRTCLCALLQQRCLVYHINHPPLAYTERWRRVPIMPHDSLHRVSQVQPTILWMCARHGRPCLDWMVSNLQPTLDSFARKLTRDVWSNHEAATHPPEASGTADELIHLINSLIEIRCPFCFFFLFPPLHSPIPVTGIWASLSFPQTADR